ncbi:hypothetical protein LXL04_023317 [Taraxacum kok-saghyz]
MGTSCCWYLGSDRLFLNLLEHHNRTIYRGRLITLVVLLIAENLLRILIHFQTSSLSDFSGGVKALTYEEEDDPCTFCLKLVPMLERLEVLRQKGFVSLNFFLFDFDTCMVMVTAGNKDQIQVMEQGSVYEYVQTVAFFGVFYGTAYDI